MSSKNSKTLVLSSNDIAEIITEIGIDTIMDTLITRLTDAFTSFNPLQTIIPARSGFHYDLPAQGLIEWMPLHDHGNQVVVKMVGYHPENPDKFGLPTIVSTISSYDTATGHLNGLMDGVFLTALRTGAASALASRLLAHPESKILGLVGCGAQAVTQLHAISRVFDLDQVLYYDIDPVTTASFLDRVAMLDLKVTFTPMGIEDIVRQSDIITTCTSIDVGKGPLWHKVATKDYLHINAIGSDFPGKTELPLDFLKNSFVCPDFMDQAVIEGECQQLEKEDIGPTIVEVIQNQERYTHVKSQRSVFDSTGLSLEDQVVIALFMEYAKQLKLGQEIAIEALQDDPKNPYHFLSAEAVNLRKNGVLDLNKLKEKVMNQVRS